MAIIAPERRPETPALTQNMGKGRLLYVPDIEQDLLRGRYTATWITRFFAPEYKLKVGRRPCWWEADAIAWVNAQTDGRG